MPAAYVELGRSKAAQLGCQRLQRQKIRPHLPLLQRSIAITAKWASLLQMASAAAVDSPCESKHGAVLLVKKKPLVAKCNTTNRLCIGGTSTLGSHARSSLHAEVAALLAAKAQLKYTSTPQELAYAAGQCGCVWRSGSASQADRGPTGLKRPKYPQAENSYQDSRFHRDAIPTPLKKPCEQQQNREEG